MSDLIDRSVDRLLEVDSPSLETMKMQVAFDSSYIAEEEDLTVSHQRRNERLRGMQRTIATMRPKDGTDFDALTALHRQVCRGGRVVSRDTCRTILLVVPGSCHTRAFNTLAAVIATESTSGSKARV